MNTTITINFTPEGKLELPPEISQIFSEGEQYSVMTAKIFLNPWEN